MTQAALDAGFVPVDAFRAVIVGYAVIGVAMAFVFPLLSTAVEVPGRGPGIARRPASATGDPPRPPPVARDRRPAVGPVRARRVRRRLRHAGVHRVLADGPVRRRSGDGRRHPVRGQHPGGAVGARRGAPRRPLRADPDDGVHPPALERAADPGPVHADARAGGDPAAHPVQHQPDGRAHPPVVHDRRGGPRRAVGRRRHHRHRPQPGRRRLAADRRAAVPRDGVHRARRSSSAAASRSSTTCSSTGRSAPSPPEEQQPRSA